MPSLAFHDITGSALGSSQASLTQLPGVFGINRNRCSASAEISVRLGRKSAFGFPRNGRSFSPVLHICRGQIVEHRRIDYRQDTAFDQLNRLLQVHLLSMEAA